MRDRDERSGQEPRSTPANQNGKEGASGAKQAATELPSGPKTQATSSAPSGPSSAMQLPAINLPRGGGAIRGIGEKFSTNPVTGTCSLSIPIATSAGRAGFSLDLALRYDSGSGNGPFGIGWSLSPPSIARKTDKGLPCYDDANDSDIFVLAGAEDLVPARRAGSLDRDVTERGGYRIQRYRPRTEGAFARIERWTQLSTGDTHWHVLSRENILQIYGRSQVARIADPEHPDRVFSWLLEELRDDRGNVVRYVYKAEDSAGLSGTQVSEAHRFAAMPDGSRRLRSTAQRYIKRIQYGNRSPILDRSQPVSSLESDYLFEVVFDYGEHAESAPTPQEASTWSVRRDPFSNHRATFEVRTYRLCRRILMFHRMAELGAAPCLVRSTDLSYDEGPAVTYLTRATQAGYTRSADGVTYLRATLPPVELGYVRPIIHSDVQLVSGASLAGIPGGVEGTGAQWVDLNGEGIPGALIPSEHGWFFKENLGDGKLGPPRSLPSLPAAADLNGGAQQLTDVDGDGRLELVMYAPPLSGFFERTADDGWAPFRPLPSVPRIDWQDPNLRILDLDGDGLADVLVTANDAFLWFRSRGDEGFTPGQRIGISCDERRGPAIVFASSSEVLLTADMSGDGLSDLVRVRNGEVCYWPNLGHGRFGGKVTLELSACFDLPERFDPRRIRTADIDGTGTTDLIYFARDGVRLYFNHAGNALSAPTRIDSLPPVDSLAHLSVVDLLGQGTACLVFSSPDPQRHARPLAYIDLLGGKKPHLLQSIENNLGAETRVSYVPSTRFYLADKAAGQPWITRLSFPVHVVERVETFDRISQNRFVTRYTYHHGFFDGVEREFRGFGRVDQIDTEFLAALTASGTVPASNIDAASYVPPVLTRTWFHTGAFFDSQRITQQLAAEYYREPGLSDAQLAAQLLPDATLDSTWAAAEMREAARALRGSILRQEIYALDDSPISQNPYSVAEKSYAIDRLQPHVGTQYGVFFVHPSEGITYHYERNPRDPRIQHELTLEVDAFGNVRKSAAVGYGRRRPDSSLLPEQQAEQARILITYTEHDFTNLVDEDASYRTPLPSENRSFELTGLTLPSGQERFQLDALRTAARTAVPISYEAAPTAGSLQKRLLAHERMYYRSDDLRADLRLGLLESRAIPAIVHKLALTPGLITQVYGARVTADMLGREGRYIHSEGDSSWWVPSGRLFFHEDPDATSAAELSEAQQHFFLPRRLQNPFGNRSFVRYDAYDLLIQETRDALGNRVTAGTRDPSGALIASGLDYRVLKPKQVMDPNRNRTELAFDALGMVVGTAVMGKPEEQLGDSLQGFVPDLSATVMAAQLADPLASPHAILQKATTRLVYDLFAYHRSKATPSPQPTVVYTLARETHDADLVAGTPTKVQHSLSYSDGFERELQKKMQAEPGPLVPGGPEQNPRWVGSGWTVFNNKGKPVRKFEPFFSDTHHFQSDVRIGVSPVLFCDPIDRVVATLHPDHTWEKVVFDPWRQQKWDASDTSLVTDPQSDSEVGSFFLRLPDAMYLPTWSSQRQGGALGAAAQSAARKAAVHAATPAVLHLDSLGRSFLSVAHNKRKFSDEATSLPAFEQLQITQVYFDIQGNQRQVTDARGRAVLRSDFDLLNKPIHTASMEAGERFMLNDVAGKPLYSWDSREHVRRMEYDALERPTETHLRTGSGPDTIVQRRSYGEAQANPEASNLRGKLYQLFDGAGVVTHEAFDFKGNLLRESRRLATQYRQALDFSGSVTFETSAYTRSTAFDALSRPTRLATPDGGVLRPGYNEANLLERVDANLRGAATVTPFVSDIDYDAKGQRTAIVYGNGTSTAYTYDPLTFRLIRLLTTRGSEILQDLNYTYDPVGNITNLRDDAQQTVYFRNKRVEPSADYTYDALYQLIDASGREHLGQLAGGSLTCVPTSSDDAPRVGILHPGDGNALGRYLQKYLYDEVGNLLKMVHRGTDPTLPGWTRDYAYDEPSQLESGKTSNRLSTTTIGTDIVPYTHDAHGNMTAMPHLSLLQWDENDALQASAKQVIGGGPPEITYYVYDAQGQRVRKVTDRPDGTRKNERIYLDSFEIYREYAADGTTVTLERQTLHVMDDQRRIAIVETRTIGTDPSPAQLIRYQLSNHLQSAALELDDNGQIISYEEYYPYGSTSYQAVRNQTETPKRYRFTGKERDEETGLYYHGARYYAAWLGRWTAADPAGMVDGVNLYGYVRNNSVRRLDPTGQTGIEVSPSFELPKAAALSPAPKAKGAQVVPGSPPSQKSAGAPRTGQPAPTESAATTKAKLVRELLVRALEKKGQGDLANLITVGEDGRLIFSNPTSDQVKVPKFWEYLVDLSSHPVGAIILSGTVNYDKNGHPESVTTSNKKRFSGESVVDKNDISGITIYTESLFREVDQRAPGKSEFTSGPAPLAVLITSAAPGQRVDREGFAKTIIHELVLHIARAFANDPSSHLYTTDKSGKEEHRLDLERKAADATNKARGDIIFGKVQPLYKLQNEIEDYF